MRTGRFGGLRKVWVLVYALVFWAALLIILWPSGPVQAPAQVVWAAGSNVPPTDFRYLAFPRHAEVPVWDSPESGGPPTAALRRAIVVSQEELALAYLPIAHTHGEGFIRFADLTFDVPDDPRPLIRELERDFASRDKRLTCDLTIPRGNLHILTIRHTRVGSDQFRYVVADGAVSPREHRSHTYVSKTVRDTERRERQFMLWFAVAAPLTAAWGVLRFCTRRSS